MGISDVGLVVSALLKEPGRTLHLHKRM